MRKQYPSVDSYDDVIELYKETIDTRQYGFSFSVDVPKKVGALDTPENMLSSYFWDFDVERQTVNRAYNLEKPYNRKTAGGIGEFKTVESIDNGTYYALKVTTTVGYRESKEEFAYLEDLYECELTTYYKDADSDIAKIFATQKIMNDYVTYNLERLM